jgi:branched-chain amino acid transport system substrate-binding protein
VLKQFTERGLAAAGIRLICTGDVLDDDLMAGIGAAAKDVVSSHHYSAAHPSAANKEYVDAMAKANKGMRAAFIPSEPMTGCICSTNRSRRPAGMRMARSCWLAMKGMSWESVRGPVSIDAATRDIVQTVYAQG